MSIPYLNEIVAELGQQMLADSAHWFPAAHQRGPDAVTIHFALGIGGEAGEVLDVIKKADLCGLTDTCDLHADGKHSAEALASEMADLFTYLLALAAHQGIDLIAAYEAKRAVNVNRWGAPPWFDAPASTTEQVPAADAIGRVAARGNRNDGWTIERAGGGTATCRSGMMFRHDGTIEVCAPSSEDGGR